MLVRLTSLLFFLQFLNSCATTTAIIDQRIPPEFSLEGHEFVSVEEFTGTHSEEVRTLIEQTLLDEKFRVVDRKRLKAVVRERMISKRKKPVKGASIIMSGFVQNYKFKTIPYRQAVTCSNGEYGYKTTLNSVGEIEATVRFTDAGSGELIHTARLSGKASDSQNYDSCSNYGIEDKEALIMEAARKSFRQDFLSHVSYGTLSVPLTLFEADRDLLPELDAGHRLMKENQLQRALPVYEKAVKKAREKQLEKKILAHALYALGVTRGYLGVDGAIEAIDEAYSLNPEEKYLKQKEYIQISFSWNKKLHNI